MSGIFSYGHKQRCKNTKSRLRGVRDHAAQVLYLYFPAVNRPDHWLREFAISNELVEGIHGFRCGRCDDCHRSKFDEESHLTPVP